ncbi:hypothetical protein [Paraburkholderia saeva]|uniref:hypothetical protein n=1 Tax=Paraburkholderia saeva TaxID=2777537 RepID=UPI001E139DE7|nr:hypothetical protein [Paraburkholderia saeva]CAG4924690.1 hypothetical protein R52603_05291 [Paraburkholderia saeva]
MADNDDTARPDTPQTDERPTKIIVPFGVERVRVNVAIEAAIAVAANRGQFPPAVDFYAQDVGDDGEPVGEILMAKSNGAGLALHRAKVGFADACKKLGITPRDPYNPLADDYSGTAQQNIYYTITVDEWARYAAAYGAPFEVESQPDITQASGGKAQAEYATWQDAARAIADEFYDHDTKEKTRDSLKGYSKRVMDEMPRRDIRGPQGRIDNPATVQREALQGEKWWAKKPK